MQENTIHIGKIICEHLEKEGRKKTWLAKQINYTDSCLCKILRHESIHTDLLLRISIACKYDFARHITQQYEKLSE